jgi:hypothetical protein
MAAFFQLQQLVEMGTLSKTTEHTFCQRTDQPVSEKRVELRDFEFWISSRIQCLLFRPQMVHQEILWNMDEHTKRRCYAAYWCTRQYLLHVEQCLGFWKFPTGALSTLKDPTKSAPKKSAHVFSKYLFIFSEQWVIKTHFVSEFWENSCN